MSRRYQIGLIGTGARGETFARQLHEGMPRAALFGVCDIDADRLGKFADYLQLKNTRTWTDPDEFFKQPELDGVIITTPEFTHAEVAMKAMAHGKHIYLEKPIAHTIEASQAILEANRKSKVAAVVGFNLRATPLRQKLKAIIQSGVLGQIVQIDGIEQLSQAHGASFMRRFHRKTAHTGGLLNHKCSHDLDILSWLIGHEHHVTRLASFGGTNVFTPQKKPAEHCSQCPADIWRSCAYKAQPGSVFPITAASPMYHQNQQVYGGDLCVYSDDKDIVDNQTVILEWDHGVRGTFQLSLFQHRGGRRNRVVGEKGYAELNEVELPTSTDRGYLRVVDSDTGDTIEHRAAPRSGGHGGADASMIDRFLDVIEGRGVQDSGLREGHVASVLAIKAEEARRSGTVVNIPRGIYC